MHGLVGCPALTHLGQWWRPSCESPAERTEEFVWRAQVGVTGAKQPVLSQWWDTSRHAIRTSFCVHAIAPSLPQTVPVAAAIADRRPAFCWCPDRDEGLSPRRRRENSTSFGLVGTSQRVGGGEGDAGGSVGGVVPEGEGVGEGEEVIVGGSVGVLLVGVGEGVGVLLVGVGAGVGAVGDWVGVVEAVGESVEAVGEGVVEAVGEGVGTPATVTASFCPALQ